MEITQELFNKNFADAQTFVLRSLRVIPTSACNIQDIAADALQNWLRKLFHIASLNWVVRVEDSVSSIIKESEHSEG